MSQTTEAKDGVEALVEYMTERLKGAKEQKKKCIEIGWTDQTNFWLGYETAMKDVLQRA